jgi:phage shock protein A
MSVDETAKWSIAERLKLAEALARVEEQLKAQDRSLTSLLTHAEAAENQLARMNTKIAEHGQRISAHEKIAAAIIAFVSLVAGLWKALTS